jgi:hypothetical protein
MTTSVLILAGYPLALVAQVGIDWAAGWPLARALGKPH